MSSWEEDVTTGLAELIAATGVATWRPAGAYQTGEVAITILDLPQAPSTAIALTVYGSADDPYMSDSTAMVQAIIRGDQDPRTGDRLAGSIFDLLQGRAGYTLGGTPVIEGHRTSWARLGRDQNGRSIRSDNYYLQLNIPTSHREF